MLEVLAFPWRVQAEDGSEFSQGDTVAGLDGRDAAEHRLLVFGLKLDRRAVVVVEWGQEKQVLRSRSLP